MRRATWTTAGIAVLTMGLAGCGGGDKSFEDSHELFEALELSCEDGDFFAENEPASEDGPAMSEGDCSSAQLGNGESIHYYSQVATEDDVSGDDLVAAASLDGSRALVGENWYVELSLTPSDDEAAVDQWLEEAQKKVGGELQKS